MTEMPIKDDALTDYKAYQEQIEKLNGFKLVFSNDNGESASVDLTDNKVISHDIGGIWTIEGYDESVLKINQPNEVQTYVYNSGKIFSKAEIHPILVSGKICSSSDTIPIYQCAGGLTLMP